MSASAAVAPKIIGSNGHEKSRSNADEEALDRRIKEIQEKNRLLEERQRVKQEEARENGVPKAVSQPIESGEDGRLVKNGGEEPKSRKTRTPEGDNYHQHKKNGNVGNRQRPARSQGSSTAVKHLEEVPKWSREWDAGKLPTNQWKMNVPDLDDARPSGSGNVRPRPPRANNRPGGKKPTAENYRLSQVQRNTKPVGESSRQPRAMPRNPGFFHDDRSAPVDERAADVAAASASNGVATQRRKPVITRLLPKPHQVMEKDDGVAVRNACGPRNNKVSKDVRAENSCEYKTNAADEKPQGNRESRSRYSGGKRRTSANDESDKVALAKRGKKKPQRRRSNTRDDVRRVVRSMVNQVCVELGERASESACAPPNRQRDFQNTKKPKGTVEKIPPKSASPTESSPESKSETPDSVNVTLAGEQKSEETTSDSNVNVQQHSENDSEKKESTKEADGSENSQNSVTEVPLVDVNSGSALADNDKSDPPNKQENNSPSSDAISDSAV